MAVAHGLNTVDQFLEEPIPKYAEELDGQALVDYVNQRQTFFKVARSPFLEENLRGRVMDARYIAKPNQEDVFADVHLEEEIPDEFDARQKWPECTSIGYIRDQSNCGEDNFLVI
ncbi:hypothetical protein OESDEN_02903 [Oesophagostomum dentatum]|uniref:Uncharacterized protein n=1 Tax=Oesophagostomum dentatum TaxID=61180 RepID=A0A0B1TM43_OESDE|nr:hypothetical protein OESDEN_02903 [Oesophagostomum dentatum]